MIIPTAEDLAVILIGLAMGGALVVFVIDTVNQIHRKERP